MTESVLTLREWSRVTPTDKACLRGLRLTGADRNLLEELTDRTSLRVEEWRQGLIIQVGPHVGTVTLSALRIVILPKLPVQTLLAMVAYALDLADLCLVSDTSNYASSPTGIVDLLGIALLREVKGVINRGLLARHQYRQERRTMPRGRIDMRYAATQPKRTDVRCEYTELTTDHELNRAVAAGLRLTADLVKNSGLQRDLRRIGERFFGDQRRIVLDDTTLGSAWASLDRRSRHYEPVLKLVTLLYRGGRLGSHRQVGDLRLSSFLLDMNRLFERFLTRHLQQWAPADITVLSQASRSDVFTYPENPRGWRQPAIRPDFVFLHQGKPVAIGDAKYREHQQRPPSIVELYQLTAYGLAYELPDPREVLLFYPLVAGMGESPAQVLFAPSGTAERVRIRLIGVPVDRILAGQTWWPLS